MFARVDRREDVYSGSQIELAPDLLLYAGPGHGLMFNGLRPELRARTTFAPFVEYGFTGAHEPAGIYVVAGDGIAPLGSQPEAPIEALAPTILCLLGLPVPDGMDAAPLLSLLTPEARDDTPLRWRPIAIRRQPKTAPSAPTRTVRRSRPGCGRSGTSSEPAVRIAVYCPHYEDAGGVQEVVRRLTREMVARGHGMRLVAREPGGSATPLPPHDATTGAEVSRVRFVRAPHRGAGARAYRHFLHRFPGSALRLVRALRASPPDLIATHCSKFHAPYVAAMRTALRVPVVVHLHNGPRTADGPKSLVLSRMLLRCARRVIAVSAPVADYARGVLPVRAGSVVTVPNGADQDEFAGVAAARRDRAYVFGAGALAWRKGFDVLLDAFAAADLDLDLVLAGDGPERAALAQRAADRGVARRVHFLGHVDRATVASLLRGACVVAMPSRFEGHPLIALEAMLAGVPLVASDIPGLPPELRDGASGLLVPAEDVGALAAALRRVGTSTDAAQAMGLAAREAARRFPSWEAVTDRVLAEYDRALR